VPSVGAELEPQTKRRARNGSTLKPTSNLVAIYAESTILLCKNDLNLKFKEQGNDG